MKRTDIGKRGEDVAVKYLESGGFDIMERNYRSGHLETDIIYDDGTHTVFAEIKTRTPASKKYGRPSTAVDAKKRENLIRCAEAYMRKKRAEGIDVKPPRIDVIEVYMELGDVKITHIKNAVIKENTF